MRCGRRANLVLKLDYDAFSRFLAQSGCLGEQGGVAIGNRVAQDLQRQLAEQVEGYARAYAGYLVYHQPEKIDRMLEKTGIMLKKVPERPDV